MAKPAAVLPIEPILAPAALESPPPDIQSPRPAASAPAGVSLQRRMTGMFGKKKEPPPLTPEEYWQRKAQKYGWKANTGNYARDQLANERTFLAWFRTSATFFSIGALITKLTGVRNAIASGIILMSLGALVMLYSLYRYFAVKKVMDEGFFAPNLWGVVALVVLTAIALTAIVVLSVVTI